MKIYFIGAHSTGKSSLARIIAKEYDLPFLNEVARTVLAEKELQLDTLRVNLDLADQYQTEIFLRQIQEENKLNNFVSDRSFDNLAYMAQHARLLAPAIARPEFLQYIEKLKQSDVIIFFVRPSKVTLKDDGVRETLNWEGIVAIDAMIKLLLEMFSLNYISVNTESMQERVRLVDSVLKLTHLKPVAKDSSLVCIQPQPKFSDAL